MKRYEATEADRGAYFFYPPELMGGMHHEQLKDAPTEVLQAVGLQYLYQYMHFTTVLEQVVVLPVTSSISLNRYDVDFAAQTRAGAYKITTDEAWHAQSAYDYTEALAKRTAIAPTLVAPAFEWRLEQIFHGTEGPQTRLLRFFSAVVSETLISSLLADIPHDERILPSAREVVADHAKDEGRHNVFFRSVLDEVWPHLSPTQRQSVVSQLPRMVEAFLAPDVEAEIQSYCSLGSDIESARSIVKDSPPSTMTSSKQRPARDTITAFGRTGAFRDEKIAEKLLAEGFLDERLDKHWL
ncbi:hypothetical protein J3A64_002516 [Pseudarthrobacter sp. PvP004]|uniref:diiron oxygenase n=1 Tax=Pseudarthrobacter sp. PvP004 TaxID=2817850 RepID=UPI001AE3D813|nr:diiron oxygenase [Pseudarthrobacter sp. PvP004]MBP2267052.1 hypothetical protein [Pseudarthrobacter sp. PvP004]